MKLKIVNKKNLSIQFAGLEIPGLGSISIPDDEWKKIYAENKVVRELLAGNFIEVCEEVSPKKNKAEQKKEEK